MGLRRVRGNRAIRNDRLCYADGAGHANARGCVVAEAFSISQRCQLVDIGLLQLPRLVFHLSRSLTIARRMNFNPICSSFDFFDFSSVPNLSTPSFLSFSKIKLGIFPILGAIFFGRRPETEGKFLVLVEQ